MRSTKEGQPLISVLKRLDFIAPEPKLNIGGWPSLQTYVGAFISVVMTSLLAIGWILIMHDFIRTDQPDVNEQRRYDSYYPDFDLQAEGHIPLLNFNEKFFG